MKLRQFIPVLIIAAGIWAYHNSFQGPFILDDGFSILENPHIRHLWPIWDALSPSANSMVGGHPIVNFSLALNYALGGLAVSGYHAFNLTIHIVAALTLYGIVRRTLLRPVLGAHFGASALPLAVVVAILWAVHPLQTEAVTYVSQRGESLMGLFYLLTLYGFIRGAESPGHGRWFVLSVVACALGMATKEVMVTAPLMVLLYDRTFVSQRFREAWSRHGQLYLGLASTWLLLGYLMAGSRNLLDRGVGYGLGVTWWTYALTECRVVVHYLWLALWPHPLVLDYGDAVSGGVTVWHFAEAAPYALILAVLVAGVLFELRRRPAIGFLGVWFFVILAPSSSVVPVTGQPMAEHRMYLPLAAVVTLVVVGAVALGKRLFNKQQGVVLGCVAGGAVVVLLSFLTIQRNQEYNSAVTIWEGAVEKCPNNSRAHYNLGAVLIQTGKLQDAIGHLEQAVRIQPSFAEAHNSWGLALMRQGRLQEAISHYDQALRIEPDNVEAHFNLGLASTRLGKIREAIEHYMDALRIKPDFTQAHYNLGNALLEAGNVQEAIGHYEQAVQIKPDFAEAHNKLGAALRGQGRLQEAIGHYEQALRLKPNYAEADYNLGNALLQAGKVQEAIGHYEQALRLRPDSVEAHSNLGNALLQAGKVQEAIGHYEEALRLKPSSAEPHYNLGVASEKLGRMQEAIQHYEQALRIKPDFVQAQNALARARAVQ